jgi:hypothetical protein
MNEKMPVPFFTQSGSFSGAVKGSVSVGSGKALSGSVEYTAQITVPSGPNAVVNIGGNVQANGSLGIVDYAGLKSTTLGLKQAAQLSGSVTACDSPSGNSVSGTASASLPMASTSFGASEVGFAVGGDVTF